MRRFHLVSVASLIALSACNSARKPSGETFKKTINEYLATHGEVCTVIARQFPIDVPRSEQREQYGIGPKLAALEQAGLVQAADTTAVVHGMLDALRGPTSPQRVKRYELTTDGKKYFKEIRSTLGQSGGFCYGQKSVDSIVNWTEPATVGTSSQTEVTYTYKILDLAVWAAYPEVQQTFSDIRTTVSGATKTTEVAGLQLTSNGWEVPER